MSAGNGAYDEFMRANIYPRADDTARTFSCGIWRWAVGLRGRRVITAQTETTERGKGPMAPMVNLLLTDDTAMILGTLTSGVSAVF